MYKAEGTVEVSCAQRRARKVTWDQAHHSGFHPVASISIARDGALERVCYAGWRLACIAGHTERLHVAVEAENQAELDEGGL